MLLLNLNTKFLGRKNFYYKELDSTQLEIWRKVENDDIVNGMLVLSDIQTDGKR